MRKIFLLAILLLTATAVNAQIKLSAKVGTSFNVSDMTYGNSEILTAHHNPMGFHAGVALKVKLIPLLYLQGDVLYNNTNFKFNVVDGGYVKYSNHAIEVPVVVGVQVAFLRVYAGPTFSFNLATNEMKSIDCNAAIDSPGKYNKFGYQVGVGFDIAKKVTLDVSYNGKWASTTHIINVNDVGVSNNSKARNISLSVGFFLL